MQLEHTLSILVSLDFSLLVIIEEDVNRMGDGQVKFQFVNVCAKCYHSIKFNNAILAVDCGPPVEWSQGTIHLINGSTAYGHLIEYKCRRGTVFESDENQIRRCGEDSYWTGREPECVEVDCGQPSPIANGAVLVTSTTLNSTAVYSCDENFRLIGHSKSFCSENGQWNPVPPVCYGSLSHLPMHN